MDLNDKIKQILVDKSISPSHFADEIGVQRSSISHILAGRNKPSLDIVQKIVRRYPDLGMDWILEEEDFSTSIPNASSNKSRSYESRFGLNSPLPGSSDLHEKLLPGQYPVHQNLTTSHAESSDEKTIERILIFYSDGTFKQYTPE